MRIFEEFYGQYQSGLDGFVVVAICAGHICWMILVVLKF
jgi:hypothetical protein